MAILLGIVVVAIAATMIISFLPWTFKKRFTAICGTVSAILAILAFIVYRDAIDLNKNLHSSKNIMLLEEHGMLYTGIAGKMDEPPSFISNADLSSDEKLIAEQNFDQVKGDNYRLFIFQPEAFEGLNGTIPFGDVVLDTSHILELLSSPSVLDDFAALVLAQRPSVADETAVKEAIKKRFESQAELKGKLFSALVREATKEQGNRFIPMSYRRYRLQVFEQTPYFTFISLIPQSVVELMIRAG